MIANAVVSYLRSDHPGSPTVKTDSASNVDYRSRVMPYCAPYDGILATAPALLCLAHPWARISGIHALAMPSYREGPGFTKNATYDIVQLSYMQQSYYDPDTTTFARSAQD